MTVAVTGGKYRLTPEDYKFLDSLKKSLRITTLVHGDAPGSDKDCEHWARTRGVRVIPYRPDWRRHPGGVAASIRNQSMATVAQALIVFPNKSRERDMIRRCKSRKIPTIMRMMPDEKAQAKA